jgi:hypothetical protein
MSESVSVLTPDTFLQVLGLPDIERKLNGAEQRIALFALAAEFLGHQAVFPGTTAAPTPTGELPLRIPGTSLVVRLTGPVEAELKALIAVGAYILGSGHPDPQAITLVAATALLTRIRKLDVDLGERSVVDALGEPGGKSGRGIMLKLYGRPCRHPRSNCRFRAGDQVHCAISLDTTKAILEGLTAQGVLRTLPYINPPEYTVVF